MFFRDPAPYAEAVHLQQLLPIEGDVEPFKWGPDHWLPLPPRISTLILRLIHLIVLILCIHLVIEEWHIRKTAQPLRKLYLANRHTRR